MGSSMMERGELENRRSAGQALASRLLEKNYENPVVLALPRGGVPVAAEIASALHAPLDLLLVRKIGVPGQEEVALGAVVDGEHPELIINELIRKTCGISEAELNRIEARELDEIERRRRLYLQDRHPVPVAGCTAIVVDDGIATGATMRAALAGLRRRKPARLVLAVGVAPLDIFDQMFSEVNDVFCLVTPEPLHAVGLHYRDFDQVSDQEVINVLEASQQDNVR